MSYDFRKIYLVGTESGCNTDGVMTDEKNAERALAIKDWINKEFADIFECDVTGLDSAGASKWVKVYFKGTNSGIYTAFGQSQSHYYDEVGVCYTNEGYGIVNSATATREAAGTVVNNTLRLLVIKSKNGVIAGFFKNDIGSNIRAIAINAKDRFIPILSPVAASMCVSEADSTAVTFPVTRRSAIDDVFLTKFLPPTLDVVCDNVYWNMGSGVKDCAIYGIGGGSERYAELQGFDGYNTIAMKLEEPQESDFAGIKAKRG